MDKSKFKKMALMGMASGMLISQGAVADETTNNTHLAASCATRSGCGSKRQSSCATRSSCSGQKNYASCAQRGQSSCSGRQGPIYGEGIADVEEYEIGPRPGTRPHSCATRASQHSCATRGNQSSCATRGKPRSIYGEGVADQLDVESKPQNKNGRLMTEQELLSQLNYEGKALYNGLDPEGKAYALRLANQDTPPGPFKDKNEAVKIAAKKMADKRATKNYNNM